MDVVIHPRQLLYFSDLGAARLGKEFRELHPQSMRWLTMNSWSPVEHFSDETAYTRLKQLDAALMRRLGYPEWEDLGGDVIHEETIREAVRLVKFHGSVPHAYSLALVLLSGYDFYYRGDVVMEEVNGMFDLFVSYITFKRLKYPVTAEEHEQASSMVSKAAGVVPIPDLPAYLEGTEAVVEYAGKHYSTVDVLRAITAAGGVAQALETQDLEPKVTNSGKDYLKDKKKKKKKKKKEGKK